jgi:2-polyprenyl-3-methyl-5-hydroxy-6-metoxy-1,4-benzoquinol methylase
MKQHVLKWLRDIGFLGFADQLHYYYHVLISIRDNKRFHQQYPSFSTPPTRLAFESYGHTNWFEYRDMGAAHARIIEKLIREKLAEKPVRLLEWGCGAGRILRHLNHVDHWDVNGVDVDQEPVSWCKKYLPEMNVSLSEFSPPLCFETESFDVVYHYSVWTHLSHEMIEIWIKELKRVLKPGGIMIATTHGDAYLPMLLSEEQQLFKQGEIVSRNQIAEGQKYFLSFHPESRMKELLSQFFSSVEHWPASPTSVIPQDIWRLS